MKVPAELRRAPWLDRHGKVSQLKLLAFISMLLPAVSIAYGFLAAEFHMRPHAWLIYWSGAWATILLLLTLFVTPARKLFGWPQLSQIRRTVGVSAFLYTVLHIGFFLAQEEFDFSVLIEEISHELSIAVAFVSFVGLLLLALTSFDAAMARLGGRVWKRLHYLIYPTTGMAIWHFLLSPSSAAGLPFVFTGAFLWLMAWRVLDRLGMGSDLRALAGLCVGSTAFTVAFEAIWSAAAHQLDPWITLSYNFDLILGVSAGWQVFLMSAAVLAVAYLKKSGAGYNRDQHGMLNTQG